jgi:hypothetical protein
MTYPIALIDGASSFAASSSLQQACAQGEGLFRFLRF